MELQRHELIDEVVFMVHSRLEGEASDELLRGVREVLEDHLQEEDA